LNRPQHPAPDGKRGQKRGRRKFRLETQQKKEAEVFVQSKNEAGRGAD